MSDQTVLFIDGENFLHKVSDVARREKLDVTDLDIAHIQLDQLIKSALKNITFDAFQRKSRALARGQASLSAESGERDLRVNAETPPHTSCEFHRMIFYAARLREHPETKEKSKELIKQQRILKTSLEKQGFEFIIAGNVRAQMVGGHTKGALVFREKGVDVRIAVDLVSLACDGHLHRAVLCSSDSDLQPAVAELRKRDIEVVYLGFEMNPNKGLSYTTNRTVLLRNAEIADALQKL